MKFFLIVGFIILPLVGICQNESIESVKKYISRIDSLSSIDLYLHLEDRQKIKMIPLLSQGMIENETRGMKGAFSKTVVTNVTTDTIYSIHFVDNLEKQLSQMYYYRDNLLIASRIELSDRDSRKVLFLLQQYYDHGSVIWEERTVSAKAKKFRWRTDFDPQQQGNAYWKEFVKEQKLD